MKMSIRRLIVVLGALLSTLGLVLFFQNCAQTNFTSLPSNDPYGVDGGYGTGGTSGGTDTGNGSTPGGPDTGNGKPRTVPLYPSDIPNKPAKILLVIDNSFTMSQAVQQLSEKITKLVEQLPGHNLDIGITTVFGSTVGGPIVKYYVRADGTNLSINPASLPALKEIQPLQESTYLSQGKYVYVRSEYSNNLDPLATFQIRSGMTTNQQKKVGEDVEKYIRDNLGPIKQQVQNEVGLCVISRFLTDDRANAFIKRGDKVGVITITDEQDWSATYLNDASIGCRTYDHVVKYKQTGIVIYSAKPKITNFDLPAGDLFLKKISYITKPEGRASAVYSGKVYYDGGVWDGDVEDRTTYSHYYNVTLQDWTSPGDVCSPRDTAAIKAAIQTASDYVSFKSCTYADATNPQTKYSNYVGFWEDGKPCNAADLAQLPAGATDCKYAKQDRSDLSYDSYGTLYSRNLNHMKDWASGQACSARDFQALKNTFSSSATNCRYASEQSENIYQATKAEQLAIDLCSTSSADYPGTSTSYASVVKYIEASNNKPYDINSCAGTPGSPSITSSPSYSYTVGYLDDWRKANFAKGLYDIAQARFAGNVYFSSIINIQNMCTLKEAQSYGTRYIELTNYFKAKAVSRPICGNDYTESLLMIGDFVQQVQTEYDLPVGVAEKIVSVILKYKNNTTATLTSSQYSYANGVFKISASLLTNVASINVTIGPK